MVLQSLLCALAQLHQRKVAENWTARTTFKACTGDNRQWSGQVKNRHDWWRCNSPYWTPLRQPTSWQHKRRNDNQGHSCSREGTSVPLCHEGQTANRQTPRGTSDDRRSDKPWRTL